MVRSESKWYETMNSTPKSQEPKMRKTHLASFSVCFMLALLLSVPVFSKPRPASQDQRAARAEQNLQKEVRHELVMLPYYSVFDNLAYRVQDDKVELDGQVTRPTLKSDAENVVKRIEGVRSVTNNIEVLPPLAHGRPTPPRSVPCNLQRRGPLEILLVGRAIHSHHREKRTRGAGGSRRQRG